MTNLKRNSVLIILIAFMLVTVLFGVVIGEVKIIANQEVAVAETTTISEAISTEAQLEAFLNAEGTESSPKRAHLTTDITYTKKLSGRKVYYHYLYGNGYTITLTDTRGTLSSTDNYVLGKESGMGVSTQSITNIWNDENMNEGHANYNDYINVNNSDYPGYSNKEMPFGYPSKEEGKYQEFHASGYFGGLGKNCEFKDIKFNFTGQIYHDQARDRGMALGLIFGTTSNVIFDNISMIIDGKIYFRFKLEKIEGFPWTGEANDTEGRGTLCLGGIVGFAHKGTVVKNSYIELNSYITGVTSGRKTGAYERGYLRTFVGGVAGALLNGAKVYNLTCAGGGSLRATEEGESNSSGENKIGFSGLVAGTTLGGDKQLYNPANTGEAEYKNNVTDGIVDGVISSWTGMAFYHTNGKTGPNYTGISIRDNQSADDHYYVGCLVGATSANSTKNISYTFNDTQTEAIMKDRYVIVKNSDGLHTGANYDAIVATKAGTFDSLEFRPAGFYGSKDGKCSSNKLSIRMRDEGETEKYKGVVGTYNSSTVSFVNPISAQAVGLKWSDTTESAKLLLFADMNVLYPNADTFLWSVNISGSGLTSQEITSYDKANNIEEIKANYIDAEIQLFSARDINEAKANIDIDYGYAVKYRFNDVDDNEVVLKDPDVYNGLEDRLADVPLTMELVVPNGDVDVPLKMAADDVNANILKENNGKVLLNNQTNEFREATWKVFYTESQDSPSFIERSLNFIRDAGYYEIVVSNGEYDSPYEFISHEDKIVSYKVDNNHYVEGGSKWQQKYTYEITPKDLNGAWSQVRNEFDNETYTAPEDFIYCGANVNFSYNVAEGVTLYGTDTGSTNIKYYQINYIEINERELNIEEIYYKKDGSGYALLGRTSDSTFESGLGTYYYRRDNIEVANIKNVGRYKIEIVGFNNRNYNLVVDGARTFEIQVLPREIGVKFQNLEDYHYDGNVHKANYIILDKLGGNVVANPCNTTEAEANIVVYNVFESDSAEVVYTANNNYVNKGIYTMEIKTTSGVAEENYVLPSSTSTNIILQTGESFDEVVEIVPDENGKVVNVIRKIEIGNARPWIVRTIDGLDEAVKPSDEFIYNDKAGKEYAKYENISGISAVKVEIDGVQYDTYFEREKYFGANVTPAAMLGVKRVEYGKEYYENIYVNEKYYKATKTTVDGVEIYVADISSSVPYIETIGTYIVEIQPLERHADYETLIGYSVYEVTPITANLSMSLTEEDAPTSMEYTSEDLSENFTKFATMSGLSKIDTQLRGYGLKFDFYIEDSQYVEADKLEFNGKTYKPVDQAKNAGNYIVIANNNLPEANYGVVTDATCTQMLDGKPYHTFEITKRTIEVSVQGATKTYSYEFDGVLGYEITSGEIAANDIDEEGVLEPKLLIKFTSDGTKADAPVIDGGYEIVSAIEGTSKDNYIFNIDATSKFIVEPLLLRYFAGKLTKDYGDAYDVTTIVTNPLENQIYGTDDVNPVYASEGFAEGAVVGKYAITATLQGADAANYTIEAGGEITVNKKRLTLGENSVLPSANLIYDATQKDVEVIFTGARAEDTITPVVVYNKNQSILPIAAGVYEVMVIDIDEESKKNYTFTRSGKVDAQFTIEKRTVTVNIQDFTMGYGDTSLKPNDGEAGFEYKLDSLEFIAEDAIEFKFETLNKETMLADVGEYEGVVQLIISGEKAVNYDLAHETYGKLTITQKDMETAALVKETVEYNGSNLIEEIKVDSSSEDGFNVVIKFNGEEVEEVTQVGTYLVEVTGDGVNFTSATKTLEFVVGKGSRNANYLSAADLEVRYNKIIVAGKTVAENSKVFVSATGEDNTWLEQSTLEFKDISTKNKEIYIKLGEDDNYLESEVIKIKVSLAYNPNDINTELNKFTGKFTFADVKNYKNVMENYNKVADADKELVDNKKLEEVTANYNKLLNVTKKVVESAQSAAGKVGRMKVNTTARTVTPGVAGVALAVMGLGICAKKKKENQEEV